MPEMPERIETTLARCIGLIERAKENRPDPFRFHLTLIAYYTNEQIEELSHVSAEYSLEREDTDAVRNLASKITLEIARHPSLGERELIRRNLFIMLLTTGAHQLGALALQ